MDVFDTVTTLTVCAPDDASAQAALQRAYDVLLACHRRYDIYHTYEGMNNLKTVNDSAGRAVAVDAETLALARFAKEAYALTGGRVNAAMGAALTLWHDESERARQSPELARLPDEAALRAAALHTNIDDLLIDEAGSTLTLSDPQLRLDVGAIGKGYATELAARALIDTGVTSALLSVGGNVRAIGAREDGTAWRVGVQSPDDPARNLTVLMVRDLSIVTSGDYQRYFTVDGRNYHHIIDPDTLYPGAYWRAVTVATADAGLADALSTALFLLPMEEGQALLDRVGNAEALWVAADGAISRSPGFSALTGEKP